MNGIQRRQLDMLRKVSEFGQDHRDVLSTSASAQRLLAAVGTTIDDVTTADRQKRSASLAKQGQVKATARRALIDVLNQGVQLTKVLQADGHTIPPCDMPRSRSDQSLLTAVRQLADTAAAHAADFDEHELSSARLTAVADAFEAAATSRTQARLRHVGAISGIDNLLKAGLRQARRLDPIVAALCADDGKALSEWQVARRIEDVRGRKRKDGGSEPAPETAPAAPSTPSEHTPPAVAA